MRFSLSVAMTIPPKGTRPATVPVPAPRQSLAFSAALLQPESQRLLRPFRGRARVQHSRPEIARVGQVVLNFVWLGFDEHYKLRAQSRQRHRGHKQGNKGSRNHSVVLSSSARVSVPLWQIHATANSRSRRYLIRSRSSAAFSNSNFLACSRISNSSRAIVSFDLRRTVSLDVFQLQRHLEVIGLGRRDQRRFDRLDDRLRRDAVFAVVSFLDARRRRVSSIARFIESVIRSA